MNEVTNGSKADLLSPQTLSDEIQNREYVCGWGAAFINIVVTFPLNKVMFRQMLHGVKTAEAIGLLRKEGFRYLYRGVIPPLIQKTLSVSVMFGSYNQCNSYLTHNYPGVPHWSHYVASAVLAGSLEAILTPFERVQTLMQDNFYHKKYRNSIHAFSSLRSYGVTEYYRGFVPILVRNGGSNVMFFGLRGEVKKLLVERTPLLTILNRADHPKMQLISRVLIDFLSGAVVGAFISTVFYPANVLKTRMQSQVGGSSSVRQTWVVIFNERDKSWRKIFLGVHMNYTRALLSWGIINASYEFLMEMLAPHPGKSSQSIKDRHKDL